MTLDKKKSSTEKLVKWGSRLQTGNWQRTLTLHEETDTGGQLQGSQTVTVATELSTFDPITKKP